MLTLVTGLMVMPRTPLRNLEGTDEPTAEDQVVDASLLPPG